MVECLAQQLQIVTGRGLDPVREATVQPQACGSRKTFGRCLADEVVSEADRPADLDAKTPGDELPRGVTHAVDVPVEHLGDLVDEERPCPDGQRREECPGLAAQGPEALPDESRRIDLAAAPGKRLQPERRAPGAPPQLDGRGLIKAL